ncbi:MAG: 1-deoxy-D-xylulose-5-phosphate synthase [Clostridia bacterium]|nr:1-deoxy-D-xylulose-5-phosphate synthase [Clostridia bacterium]
MQEALQPKELQQKEQYPILSRINSPEDLKALPEEEISALAEEIRAFLIGRIQENGGHLASNLGVVEMTLAIHRVFSTPHDHVIFDVGHQSYVHKLLTGRRDQFSTLRQGGGISGFPKREESEHDCFGTGHSSTSLSAALGFAEADRLSGSDAYTVCVLGDGAYTGGMIHEALNNCRKKLRLIIILNENEMSISKNIGRFAKNLSHLRSKEGYFRTKSGIVSFLSKIPLVGNKLQSLIRRIKMGIKAILYGSNYFENLGLYYLGPVDGNDEEAVEVLLREAKQSKQSCIIHLKTKKGKGFAPAEATPDRFHGMSPSNRVPCKGTNFSEEMGKLLTGYAAKNNKVCAITAAMESGTGLTRFRQTYPSRFFDVGIAEEHAVTFAAGLAANGYRPVVALYSTFLQRAYDSVIHDVALQNLPVVFCIDRAGLNSSDGATHHGIFDVAFLSQIPNLTIYTPITHASLKIALEAALRAPGPVAIRYPNGYESEEVVRAFYGDRAPKTIGVRSDYAATDAEALDAVIITHGRIVSEAMRAKRSLREQGISVGILLLERLKPYESLAEQILPLLPQKPCRVLLLEEEIKSGGMGMLLSDALSVHKAMQNKTVQIMALDDEFGIQTKCEPILQSVGLDAEHIVQAITKA